jgi:hypothetical protein
MRKANLPQAAPYPVQTWFHSTARKGKRPSPGKSGDGFSLAHTCPEGTDEWCSDMVNGVLTAQDGLIICSQSRTLLILRQRGGAHLVLSGAGLECQRTQAPASKICSVARARLQLTNLTPHVVPCRHITWQRFDVLKPSTDKSKSEEKT